MSLKLPWHRHADDLPCFFDADVDDPADLESALPPLVPLPPATRVEDADAIAVEAAGRYVHAGLPTVTHPNRPLACEEELIRIHDVDQGDLTTWSRTVQTLIPALLAEVTEQLADLADKKDSLLARKRRATDQRDRVQRQLDEPDRAFTRPPSGWVIVAGVALGLALATLEVSALEPIVGKVLAFNDWLAWGFTIVAVAAITVGCFLGGVLLIRWLLYEGPGRIRRAYAAGLAGTALVAIVALAAVVLLRVEGSSYGTPPVVAALYAAVQASVELIAAAEGCWHGHPRVREIRACNQEEVAIEAQLEDIRDDEDDANQGRELLQEFSIRDFLATRRAQVAQMYAAADLAFRDHLGTALIDAGHTDSADTLVLLPLPQFVAPAVEDDDGEWLTGGFQIAV